MRKSGSKVLLISALICALLLMTLQWSLWHWRAAYVEQSHVEIASISPAERSAADVLAARRFVSGTPARPQQFYGYNHTLSDKIGAFRALPDSRNAACERRLRGLPQRDANVSVIIAFHNEARATLLRTIMSVHERSPAKYLHELILVDDYSEDVSLLSQLRQLNFAPFMPAHSATSTLSLTIKMQRNTRRLGLIESRNRGARLASGDYLLFLDSHCEVNVGWLEPLLQRVAAVTGIAVSPVLDSIDAQTLQYRASSMNFVGGFDWNLHFHWVPRERQQQWQGHWARESIAHSSMKPFKSPTFAGGIFMISRNWFFKLEAFNSLLEIWGGESIEFSIKLWLCGGQIEIVPCSRVGHIFRRQHPFQFPRSGDGQATYLRNSKIIAESWLDAYKYYFYASKPAAQHIDVEIPHAALAKLRRDLQCRPFAWYLQHVFQQLKPSRDEFNACGTLSCGQRCLRIVQPSLAANKSSVSSTSQLLMSDCFDVGVTQWNWHRHSARLQSSGGTCLHVLSQESLQNVSRLAHSNHVAVLLQPCQKSAASQQRWQRRGAQLMHVQTHLCLDNPLADEVTVSLCRPAAPTQQFRFSLEVQQL